MEASALSPAERAAERAAQLRVAKYALLGAVVGALIGGVGSFLGAYMTYRAQTQTHTEDVKTEAYTALVSNAERYYVSLGELEEAASNLDQDAYTDARAKLIELANTVYGNSTAVYIASDNEAVVRTASAVVHALFKRGDDEPASVKDVEIQGISDARDEADHAIDEFLDAARADLTG